MTSLAVIRSLEGSFGVVKETYLLPNTVVAVMSAWTLRGIRSRYSGLTSRMILARGSSSTVTCSTCPTRPICTPL